MKYIVKYGYGNAFKSDSRNARKHARDLGESVTIYDKRGNFVCSARYEWDGKKPVISVYTRH